MFATTKQIAQLFDCNNENVIMHIKNIFHDGELQEDSVTKEFLATASDGKNYKTKHYALDLIIAIGYRVNSKKATQFRIWATRILQEYIIKGFSMDDERLKDQRKNKHFDELLQRIREIRLSEKLFYQKIKDVYTLADDYDKNSKQVKTFFKTVQNKMIYAVLGKTAAELILNRINENDLNLGLTS